MAAFPPDSALVQRILPSPNHGERRGARRPDCIILHYTGLPTLDDALDTAHAIPRRRCPPTTSIDEAGAVMQLVAGGAPRLACRASVPGRASAMSTRPRSASRSPIPATTAACRRFPDAQIAATIALVKDIASRWSIRPERVLAHSDIAPARKRDPGERFPWARLAAAKRRALGRARADRGRAAVRVGGGRPADPRAAGDAGALWLRRRADRRR